MIKLGIVIPLKSKVASRDWAVTSACLKRTLTSLEAQTSGNWVSVVVGHERPDCFKSDCYRTDFSSLELPAPQPPPGAHRTRNAMWEKQRILDKNRKLVRGLQLLCDRGIDYWFYLDADDLLHREFTERVSRMNLRAGAILDGGYVYFPSTRRILPESDMSAICGSTSILRAGDVPIPDSLEIDCITRVPWCRYSHMQMDRYFQNEAGGEFLRIGERLIAYSMGHGDNCSDGYRDTSVRRLKAWLKPYVLGLRLSPAVRSDFSLA